MCSLKKPADKTIPAGANYCETVGKYSSTSPCEAASELESVSYYPQTLKRDDDAFKTLFANVTRKNGHNDNEYENEETCDDASTLPVAMCEDTETIKRKQKHLTQCMKKSPQLAKGPTQEELSPICQSVATIKKKYLESLQDGKGEGGGACDKPCCSRKAVWRQFKCSENGRD